MGLRERWDSRAAKHKPCPACSGRRGSYRPHPFAGVAPVDGSRTLPADARLWVDCNTCNGLGTLTRLCIACMGTGGRVVRHGNARDEHGQRVETWEDCKACCATGRATGRGRSRAERELAEALSAQACPPPQPPPGTTSPESPLTSRTVEKPDARGAAGVVGGQRCRRGGGLHCQRPTAHLCDACAGGAS